MESKAAEFEDLTGAFLDSYLGDERARRISQRYLPSREAIVEILEAVLDLMYPGYFGGRNLSGEGLERPYLAAPGGAVAQART